MQLAFSLFTFAAACVGHLALFVWSHNWWYAQPLAEGVAKCIRLVHAAAILAVPVLAWWFFGFDLLAALEKGQGGGWQIGLALYFGLCCIVGLGVFPAITLGRLLRGKPILLESNHTNTIDIKKDLGYLPAGPCKHSWLARLPGNQIFQVDFNEKTMHLPRLPAAWDGLTILHLSDLHFIGTPDRFFYQRVMDECVAWEPDLIAVTGDIVDSDFHRRWIVPVLGRLKSRIASYAILGNHDYWWEPKAVRRRVGRAGLRMLGNRWEQIEVRGEPLVVIGHEGPWFKPVPDLKDCPQGPFRLCLSHTPDNIRWAQRNGIDLMLAGHNHGGQIRFPIIGSVFVPSSYSRRYDSGTFYEPPTLMHVSRGLAGEHPVRYNCRPEVTKIILRAPVAH